MSSTRIASDVGGADTSHGSHPAGPPGVPSPGVADPRPARRGRPARDDRGPRGRRSAAKTGSSRRRAGTGNAPTTGRAPGHRLLLVCTGIVALGLLTVLFVNAVLSQGAFRQHELEIQLVYAAEKEEALARQVRVDEAPLTLERKAVAMGMVPAGSPVFLDLESGKIKGEPVPAPSPTAPIVVTGDELTAPAEQLSGTLMVPSSAPAPAASPAAPPTTATATPDATATPAAPTSSATPTGGTP